MKQEIWKDIPDYEGYYQASNFGNIKSLNYKRSGKENLLALNLNRGGYLKVILYKDTVKKTMKVHQLVAMAFLNHIPCGFNLVVNHKNFIRHDNRLENLEIIPQSENSKYRQKKKDSDTEGVYWHKRDKRWSANITINGEYLYLGSSTCEKEASMYYKEALISIDNGEEIKINHAKFSSKYKGISWHKRLKKWQATITVDGKNKYLGLFTDEEDAYTACKNAENNLK